MHHSTTVSGDSTWQRGASERKVRLTRLRTRECIANWNISATCSLLSFWERQLHCQEQEARCAWGRGEKEETIKTRDWEQPTNPWKAELFSWTTCFYILQLPEDSKIKSITETERECNECNSDFGYPVLLPTQSPFVINKFDEQIEPLSAEKSGFLL